MKRSTILLALAMLLASAAPSFAHGWRAYRHQGPRLLYSVYYNTPLHQNPYRCCPYGCAHDVAPYAYSRPLVLTPFNLRPSSPPPAEQPAEPPAPPAPMQ